MGLVGIHDPDALCHFGGITYRPLCRKEGQNEGTMVNHLQTVHYRLGLVCNRCYGCPSTMSDTLCCHGWHDSPVWGEWSLWVSSLGVIFRRAQLPQLRIPTRKWRWNGLPRLPWGKDQQRRCHPPTHTTHHLNSSAKLNRAAACFQYIR